MVYSGYDILWFSCCKALETHIAILELDVVELQDKLDATQKLSKVLRDNCGEPNADAS
jgi:hypothetical protein